ncbi:hypothetical protein PQX77_008962, partial [Marasmius sp. AFHP31]
LFKHWPYEDYSSKLPEHQLITRIPLDHEREALLGLLLQHSFLSQHISLYWGFVACFDIWQAPIYFYQDLLSDNPPYKAHAVILESTQSLVASRTLLLQSWNPNASSSLSTTLLWVAG